MDDAKTPYPLTACAMTVAALIVAAGRGSRLGEETPKQYLALGAHSVLSRTVETFAAHPAVDRVRVVIHPDDAELYDRSVGTHDKLLAPVAGGATRQISVCEGLASLEDAPPEQVLIHDAARPFVTAHTITAVLDALAEADGAIAAVALADTLKRGDGGKVRGTIERDGLWRAQTPQGFHFAAILDAHRRAADAGIEDFTDDAAVAEWAGLTVALVEGATDNIKITSAEDLANARQRVSAPAEPRVGQGFDVHAFTDGDHVILCGVRIAHERALKGHSDADVAMHAVTDAVLGALGEGDIGQHFPPSEPKWRGAESRIFLRDAAGRVTARGGRIAHVDVTIVCEAPRIGPHAPAMRARLAELLEIGVERVSVKATTSERLGFTGRGEGIAALASATVLLPGEPVG